MSHFNCTTNTHGQRQLEFEITYPLDYSIRSRKTYRMDVWFFIPSPLQHWCEFNPREQFFRDLITYTRFQAFPLALATLADMLDERNPMCRIRNMLKVDALDEKAIQKKMFYEMRMLVNIFQSQFSSQCDLIDQMAAGKNYPAAKVDVVIQRLQSEVASILKHFAELEPLILAPGVPQSIRNNYRWADESLSIRAEENFYRLYRTLVSSDILPELAEQCRVEIAAQTTHRRDRQYETVVDPQNDRTNERFSFREHQLKKWAESVMYMTVARSRLPQHALNLSFSIAAAVAMAFAVAVAVTTEAYFNVRSYPWAILAVAAYVFKDRIKDTMRNWAQRLLPRLISDRMQRLINPYSGRRAGITRERVSMVMEKNLPAEVLRLHHHRRHRYCGLTPPEDILHYRKEVKFRPDHLYATETRLAALCEILRLDMRHWFYKMDLPDEDLVYVEGNKVRLVSTRRVYHINIILRLMHNGDNHGPPTLYHYRLVASSAGIVRIEELAG